MKIARAALHEWEEPPLCYGKGSGAVFFSHCALRCVYCQNAPIAHDGVGLATTPERLAQIFLELEQQGACNINLVTATQYIPQVLPAIDAARKEGLGIPIMWNTSGYEDASVVERLADYVDIFLTDFKYWHNVGSDASARYSHAPDYFDVALRALDVMVDCKGEPCYSEGERELESGVVVRHLLLPGRFDDAIRIVDLLWERYDEDVCYSIMNQYTPVDAERLPSELARTVDRDEYERLLDYCDSIGMCDYFWQDGPAASESFIPLFDFTGV